MKSDDYYSIVLILFALSLYFTGAASMYISPTDPSAAFVKAHAGIIVIFGMVGVMVSAIILQERLQRKKLWEKK